MNSKYIVTLAITGFLVGVAVAGAVKTESYCQQLEKQLKQEKKFRGSLSCQEPGETDFNVSEQVENRSKLKCVCRNRYNGVEKIFPIRISQ